jgi:hypothetical protein
MTDEHRVALHQLAEERRAQYNDPASPQDAYWRLMDRIKVVLEGCKLPGPLEMALGQCLRRRWNTPYTNVCAALIDAAGRGDDYLHLAL